ncbi:MAG: GNAT family N-acetyltransferase [Chloroflexota bacterium]
MQSTAVISTFAWDKLGVWTEMLNHGLASDNDLYITQNSKELFLRQPDVGPEKNCFIADVENTPVGILRVTHEAEIHRAVANLFVSPQYRRSGIGRHLLQTAIDHASQLNTEILHIQVAVNNDAGRFLLEQAGFAAVRRYWKLTKKNEDVYENIPQPGYQLRFFNIDQDEEALTELQNQSFTGSWGFSPNTVNQIRSKVRLTEWESDGILILENSTNQMVGYNWTHRPKKIDSDQGYIGMTGVLPELRGLGLGRYIVQAGINYLNALKIPNVTLEVDASNLSARELYLSLGFELLEETVWYELNLTH